VSPISTLREKIKSLKAQRRELGWKGLLKKHGWKPIIAFVVFYLIRDTILYILIPLAIWMGVFG